MWAAPREEPYRLLEVLGEFGPVFPAMVVFSAYVGLLPGELFALERSDVGRDEVTIRQNLDGTGMIKAPNNGRERIVFCIHRLAREALADMSVRLDVPWQSSGEIAAWLRGRAAVSAGTGGRRA